MVEEALREATEAVEAREAERDAGETGEAAELEALRGELARGDPWILTYQR